MRTALSGDMACPLANSSDQGLHYINADYTMLIGRYPVGERAGLEVTQQIDADGISMGTATLVDRTGPFATSGGVLLARPPGRCSSEEAAVLSGSCARHRAQLGSRTHSPVLVPRPSSHGR